jgi:hypothetical protein
MLLLLLMLLLMHPSVPSCCRSAVQFLAFLVLMQ